MIKNFDPEVDIHKAYPYDAKRRWLYFIKQEVTECIKIGISSNVYSRITGISTGSPYPLVILECVPFGRGECKPFEDFLHQKFSEYRMCGEWFDITDEQAEEGIRLAEAASNLEVETRF